jgi:hypothetical protein
MLSLYQERFAFLLLLLARVRLFLHVPGGLNAFVAEPHLI